MQQLRFKSTSSNTTGRNSADLQKKVIKTIYEVPDESGETGFYIINFKKDGFIILSADDRLNPVRAFSNEGQFALEGEIPAGLGGWLTAEQQYVSDIRNGKIKAKKHKWTIEKINELLNSDGTIDPDNPDGVIVGPDSGGNDGIGCSNTYEEILLNTGIEWGQGDATIGTTPFNNNTPFMDCDENGRALVGCVAVAVGQIMRFHEFPENLNWPNMPLEEGSVPTAELLAEIGDFLNMTYGCESSSTYTRRADDVFIDDFGYSSAVYKDFNIDDLTSDIRSGFPLILAGGNDFDKTCVLNWCWAGGHAWVCEGFRRTVFCETGNSNLLLRMNWGWSGTLNDGWYGLDAWNPTDDRHYNTNREMIVNIRP